MTIAYIYPVALQLELSDIYGDWINSGVYKCGNLTSLKRKIETLKKIYALNNKNYRMFIISESRVNLIIDSIKIYDTP